jgi:tRNA(His) guanylyltransferase
MNEAAKAVMTAIPDTIIGYGDSDEYSFVLQRTCQLFERRESKLVSTFASTFTANYIQRWSEFFDIPLELNHLPTFDCRAVTYPSIETLRDYLSWRQADCHINNLYNTTFWALVLKGNLTPKEAQDKLSGTLASDKNEILFSHFGINYNNELDMFKKGTVIFREYTGIANDEDHKQQLTARQLERRAKKRLKGAMITYHGDIIGDGFWNARPWLSG